MAVGWGNSWKDLSILRAVYFSNIGEQGGQADLQSERAGHSILQAGRGSQAKKVCSSAGRERRASSEQTLASEEYELLFVWLEFPCGKESGSLNGHFW